MSAPRTPSGITADRDAFRVSSPQWTKAELEAWCLGFCRTPHTTLKAFIDAGFCSDQEPSREEMRLLPKPSDSTDSTTKAVMSDEVRELMAGLLKYSSPDGVIGDHFADKARALLHGSRPVKPTEGKTVWYRGWECGFHEENARWGTDGWEAYLGGADPDAPVASAFTWEGLLDEIDDHYLTGADQ
jgi:hypothetical protein